jgi:hypothetical protein
MLRERLESKRVSNLRPFQHSTIGLLLTFSFFIIKCGLDIENPTPPDPPRWVQKSLPEEWPERGIDAHEDGGIYIEWEHNLEDDIIAYSIYRATCCAIDDSIGDYTLLTRLDMRSMQNTEYIDRTVLTRSKYYYRVRSENTSGNISEYSETQYYSLLPSISSNVLSPNGISDSLGIRGYLRWYYSPIIEMEDFLLTILSEQNDLVTRVSFSPRNYIDGAEAWQLPIEIDLQPTQIYKWRIDASANYIDGRESEGSESTWATFLYKGN